METESQKIRRNLALASFATIVILAGLLFYSNDYSPKYDGYATVGNAISTKIHTPTNLKVTSVSANSVTLSWSATDRVNNYAIYKNGALFAVSSTTKYAITGLEPQTTYNFQVAAYKRYNTLSLESPPSNAAQATTWPQCIDVDGGKSFFEKSITVQGVSKTDYCKDGSMLIEHYCDALDTNGQMEATGYECPNGCQDGRCT